MLMRSGQEEKSGHFCLVVDGRMLELYREEKEQLKNLLGSHTWRLVPSQCSVMLSPGYLLQSSLPLEFFFKLHILNQESKFTFLRAFEGKEQAYSFVLGCPDLFLSRNHLSELTANKNVLNFIDEKQEKLNLSHFVLKTCLYWGKK